MKALVVSLGSIGKRHTRNLRQLRPDAQITVLRRAETDDAEASVVGANHVVHDLDSALAERPDIAIVASPSPFHIETATRLANAGVHLLIEKPLASSMDGVDELLSIGRERGVVIAVGYNFRYYVPLCVIHDAIAGGSIGRVLSVRAEVGQYLPDWRPGTDYRQGVTAREALGGGVLLEISHEIDYVRWLAGEVTEVSAETGRLGGLDIDVEDTAELLLRHESGAISNIHLDMVQRVPSRTCRIIGSEGVVAFDYLANSASLYSAATGQWSTLHTAGNIDRNQMYVDELDDFLRCASGDGTTRSTGENGRRVLQIALAARASASLGARVTL